MECSRSDCGREAVFEVADLEVEFDASMGVPGPTSYNEAEGTYAPVCAEHLPEYIALGVDGATGIERWSVRALDVGKAHLIAESFPDEARYR